MAFHQLPRTHPRLSLAALLGIVGGLLMGYVARRFEGTSDD